MEYLFGLTVLPGLAICYYIWKRDHHEPEPKKYLIWCFVFGILSTIPAIFMEVFGQKMGFYAGPNIITTFIFAFFVVAFSEEFCKFIFLRYYIYPKEEFNEPMDGIVYSVMVSMGFATLENILYVFGGGGTSVAILRMFTAVPAHAAFAVLMGYFVGLAKFQADPNKRVMFLGLGLAAAVTSHGLYDFFIFQQNFPSLMVLTFVTLILSIIISFVMIKRHATDSAKREMDAEEIDEHLL